MQQARVLGHPLRERAPGATVAEAVQGELGAIGGAQRTHLCLHRKVQRWISRAAGALVLEQIETRREPLVERLRTATGEAQFQHRGFHPGIHAGCSWRPQRGDLLVLEQDGKARGKRGLDSSAAVDWRIAASISPAFSAGTEWSLMSIAAIAPLTATATTKIGASGEASAGPMLTMARGPPAATTWARPAPGLPPPGVAKLECGTSCVGTTATTPKRARCPKDGGGSYAAQPCSTINAASTPRRTLRMQRS